MKVTVTGATGLIGTQLVKKLKERGDEVTVLSRNPTRAQEQLNIDAIAWDPEKEVAPVETLSGRDGIFHLAGEPIAQRWNDDVKQRIFDSRTKGTDNLVTGLKQANPRPPVLISSSAVGYYGHRDATILDEQSPAGDDFLAEVCKAWEGHANAVTKLGMRIVTVRTGVVLDSHGGALEKMLPPFKAGVGGPVGNGKQYVPWIALPDLVGILLTALDDGSWNGPINATAPNPVTNKELAKTLGKVLHRPAFLPVPSVALKALYGEMAQIVTTGQRVVPKKALNLGYRFQYTDLKAALTDAVG